MYRRNVFRCFPSAIPRDAWDPAHHNSEWHDSYAEHITKRRDWPTRKWLVGLVPKTPREYLEYSHRNLTYQYNARMRACTSFPEMVPYYKEMLTRGIKIDVDTMYTVLTRASRFGMITAPQIFDLCDEMRVAGARMDLTVAEVLHTVLDSVLDPPSVPLAQDGKKNGIWTEQQVALHAWKRSKRAYLVSVYNQLLKEEIHRLGSRRLTHLLQKIFAKYRSNLRSLYASPSYENYAAYVSYVTTLVPREDHAWYDRKEPSALASVLTTIEALKQDVYDAYCACIHSTTEGWDAFAESGNQEGTDQQQATTVEYLLKPRHTASNNNATNSNAAGVQKEKGSRNEDTLLCLEPLFHGPRAQRIFRTPLSGDVSASQTPCAYLWSGIHTGFSQVYLAAIENAVMRYGTQEGRPMLLYFLNAMFQNLRKDGVAPTVDVWRAVADVGKYYDRTVFLRNVVRESCRGLRFEANGTPHADTGSTPADLVVVSRYICTVDPWDTTPVNPFVALSSGATTRKEGMTGIGLGAARTSQRALRRYQEARDFLHNAVQLGKRTPSEEEKETIQDAVTALLWFTHKLLHTSPKEVEDGADESRAATTKRTMDDAIAMVGVYVLEDIATIHRGMTETYGLRRIDGEYADHFAALIDTLSRRFIDWKKASAPHSALSTSTMGSSESSRDPLTSSPEFVPHGNGTQTTTAVEEEDGLTRLARLHHELCTALRRDPTTLLAWAEIA